MVAPCYCKAVHDGSLRWLCIGEPAMERDSFIFYRSFWEALRQCPDDVRLRLYDAITDYALNFNKPDGLDGIAAIVFPLIEPQITANNKRYINGLKGREFGSLGGAPKGNKNASKTTPKGNKNNPKQQPKQPQNNPKTTPNENENVNVNVNVNELGATTLPTRTRERFVKPTINEITAYVLEKGYTFNPQAFYDYYEANGWRVGKNPMKKWKAACANWQRMETERKQQKPNQYGNNNSGDHPTNADVVRNTYEIINEFRELDEQGVPTLREF